jgi:hypothetical protein
VTSGEGPGGDGFRVGFGLVKEIVARVRLSSRPDCELDPVARTPTVWGCCLTGADLIRAISLHGQRGLKTNPVWADRRMLLTAGDRLSARQLLFTVLAIIGPVGLGLHSHGWLAAAITTAGIALVPFQPHRRPGASAHWSL